MQKLVFTTTNGGDWVLLVEDSPAGEFVRSAWVVGQNEFRNFCDCSQSIEDWDNQGLSDEVEGYGEIIAERVGFDLHSNDSKKWTDRVRFHQ